MKHLWGIDLGGTKIEGVVIDAASEQVLARSRVPTEAAEGYDHVLAQIESLVRVLEHETGVTRPPVIGIGTPGAVEPSTGLMKNSNTTALNGKPLPADLEQRLGVNLVVANDANCFALAEATLGAGKGHEVVFGVIMGTGVGGGIVVRGEVLNGAQGIAGEWGHNVLDPQGDACYCGKRGCVETVLSGPALERFYARRCGESRSLREIAARAETDADAAATIAHMVAKFGEAFAVIINILDPDAVVLGGGVGNIRALEEGAIAALTPWVFNDKPRTKVLKPTLGDSAGVFGAAMLVAKHHH